MKRALDEYQGRPPTPTLGSRRCSEMTVRDFVATHALAALIQIHADRRDMSPAVAAPRLAYEYADLMLVERARKPKGEGI